jgi:hypothetical protein
MTSKRRSQTTSGKRAQNKAGTARKPSNHRRDHLAASISKAVEGRNGPTIFVLTVLLQTGLALFANKLRTLALVAIFVSTIWWLLAFLGRRHFSSNRRGTVRIISLIMAVPLIGSVTILAWPAVTVQGPRVAL